MRTQEIKIYKFEELSEKAKQHALDKLLDINTTYDWWDNVYEDAKNISLEIDAFDLYGRGRGVEAHFIIDAETTAREILENHGAACNTYADAKSYLDELELVRSNTPEEDDPDTEDIDKEFLNNLQEDYRIMLEHEFEWLTSEEAILEAIEANEYEFHENGDLY